MKVNIEISQGGPGEKVLIVASGDVTFSKNAEVEYFEDEMSGLVDLIAEDCVEAAPEPDDEETE